MSGFKRATISINSAQARRLREAGAQVRKVRDESRQAALSIQNASQQAIRDSLKEIERRQEGFQHALSQSDSAIRDFELATSQNILQQHEYFTQLFESQSGSLYQNLDLVKQQLQEQMEHLLDEEREDRQIQFAQLEEGIQEIGNRQNRLRDLSFSWLDSALQIDNYIIQAYPCEFFAPGKLERLSEGIILASQNMAQGANEAGLAQVQQAYLNLSDLRLDLERQVNEWCLWQQVALDGIRHLFACLQNNRSLPAVDMEGHDLDLEIDINDWTGGGIDEIEAEVEDLGQLVLSGIPHISTPDFHKIILEIIPSIQTRIEQLVQSARMTALSAQVRINIADLVVQSLEDQGFSLQEASYHDGNPVNEYRAILQSLEGCEVEIIVSPSQNPPVNNELSIISHDQEQRSEHELRQRAREVARSLQHYGLNVGAFQIFDLPGASAPGLVSEDQTALSLPLMHSS